MVKFSDLTIVEFINHDKVTFFSARASPTFFHFPHQVKHVLFPSIQCQGETRKIFSIISVTRRNIRTRPSIFYYLIDMNIHTQNIPICNSGQYIFITSLCNFFSVLQDLIKRINSYFQRIDFQGDLHPIGFYHSASQVFPDQNKQSSLEWGWVNL